MLIDLSTNQKLSKYEGLLLLIEAKNKLAEDLCWGVRTVAESLISIYLRIGRLEPEAFQELLELASERNGQNGAPVAGSIPALPVPHLDAEDL